MFLVFLAMINKYWIIYNFNSFYANIISCLIDRDRLPWSQELGILGFELQYSQ